MFIIIFMAGFLVVQPNEARVLILFGAYKGTVRTSGFWWANPFYARARARIPVQPSSVSPEAVKAAAAAGKASTRRAGRVPGDSPRWASLIRSATCKIRMTSPLPMTLAPAMQPTRLSCDLIP
jgi:hypothetical protein